MTHTITGHLINWLSEILKQKFLSIVKFGNLKHWSKKFPPTAYESQLKSYGWYFILYFSKLSIIYVIRIFTK